MPATLLPPALAMDTRRRIAKRILPFLFLLFVIAFLDRVNVGYAALEMTRALSFSDRVFGLGSGLFFVGYLLFEIPGCLIVERWSARKWFARIMVSWGLITVLTGFIHSAGQFYAVRVLLGAAEAGFFPGIIVYLTHWFCAEDRAKAAAGFMTAIPVANIVGSPLAGWLLGVRWMGVAGWRWLFIFEGIPAILFGVVTYFYLTDWPRDARWLASKETDWITAQLEQEIAKKKAVCSPTVWQSLWQREVILLTFVYFFAVSSIYSLTIWLPTYLKRASGMSNLAVTMLAIIPYALLLLVMLWNGWHSDHTGERRWHTAVPLLLGAAAFLLTIFSGSHFWIAFAGLTIASMSNAFLPSFWPMPSLFLGESAAAASIGLINSIGNLGSLITPAVIGYFLDRTHSFTPGFLYVIGTLLLSVTFLFPVRLPQSSNARSPD